MMLSFGMYQSSHIFMRLTEYKPAWGIYSVHLFFVRCLAIPRCFKWADIVLTLSVSYAGKSCGYHARRQRIQAIDDKPNI